MRISPLGISHAVAERCSTPRTMRSRPSGGRTPCSSRELDVDRFFFSVRPYYKPYRVGRQEYRGANAGDFSGINEIDLLLGLCRGNDPYYSQLLVEKMLFMRPADQASLRDCLRRRSFLDQFLDAARRDRATPTGSGAMPRAFLRSARCTAESQHSTTTSSSRGSSSSRRTRSTRAISSRSPQAARRCRCSSLARGAA